MNACVLIDMGSFMYVTFLKYEHTGVFDGVSGAVTSECVCVA